MKEKVIDILKNKHKTIPILSFPCVKLMGITVNELISSAETQKDGMLKIKDAFPVGASLNMMDLSVEVEAFGAQIKFCEDEIPAVKNGIIDDISEVDTIVVPKIGAARTSIYIDGVKKAKQAITDIPVFCGVIGPYSLACRIFDMTELMMECFDSPDEVKILVEKATEFITEYIKAFKAVGADGVIIAEPAAGLLSPDLADEFSTPFVQKIIDEVGGDDFIFCYHNCGASANDMLDSLGKLDADILHFGNAIDLKKALSALPKDKVVMGNIDPVLFKTGTSEQIESEVQRIYDECCEFDNFMLSTGCDVPASASMENINAYFKKVSDIYAKSNN